ncbi:hypothetical protein [Sulfurimonas xiamenensis]|uniref:Uncharacterized protein n=1 Tax=Sulfurimonas xiamenensis TaxID=2590021 RepID=A0AAJ4DMH0_9BACT|nr:hypothetical protein [Sulfurimonas xiamenensis]QFR43041.1 hypothetical protein FJR47_03610 [Sulfurimonas xiamenensis]
MTFKINEHSVARIIVLLGIITAIVIAPKNHFFLPNFLYYWLPQGVIIGLLFLAKMRASVITGCSLTMTTFLISYAILMSSTSEPSAAMAWIVYLFSIPGALIGAFIFGMTAKKLQYNSSIVVGIGSLISTLIGVGIIQLAFCCTVMYCGFKC